MVGMNRKKERKNRQQHSESKRKKSHSEQKRRKTEPDNEQVEQTSSSTYRDRAKERREGINKDFELDPDDLIFSNPIVGSDIEEHRQKIEESKYLGGDVEHTHLVKGLDFALLEKIKAAEKQQQQQQASTACQRRELDNPIFDASDSDEEEFTKEAIKAASATLPSKGHINIDNLKISDIITCRTAIARRILKTLDEKPPDKSELFLPGRMSYVVPVEEDVDSSVTTILRSKAEHEGETLNEKDLAFDQLINIFTKIRKKK